MKVFLFFAAFSLLGIQAHAKAFEYTCVLKDEGSMESMQVVVDENSMTILNATEGNGSNKIGDLVFLNQGAKGGSGKMKDQFVYEWSKEDSSIYNWNNADEYIVQPALVSGGTALKNGKFGGFMSFVGGGYSYESYLCIR